MFTDMVGYSALSQRNEALALDLLGEQRAIVRHQLAPHDGREVKTMGDGFLIEFPSALEAVQAAVDIQTALHEHNLESEPERRTLLRVGIHIGDVVSREGDIHGDGVNIASRLEPFATPGGICVSNAVYEQVRNKLRETFVCLGQLEFKNIEQSMLVYRVVLPWESTPARGIPNKTGMRLAWSWVALAAIGLLILSTALLLWRARQSRSAVATFPLPTSLVDQKSVAVLPFANLSDDKGNEYFSDGISEELLNVLSKVPGLKVSARTSAFYFKGKQVPLAEIAKQLGVAFVVEGSVRKSGDHLRITAQLINAADGFHIWSDEFDRDAKDVFAVQDEIAALIARSLSLKLDLAPGDSRKVDSQAVELYLQGRQAWNLRTGEGFTRAEELFRRALALDPDFARAYTGLADVWLIRGQTVGELGNFGQRDSPDLTKIISQVERALALDPNSAEAYSSLGTARWLAWKFPEAEAALRHAISLNPSYANAHHWLGRVLFSQGKIVEAGHELGRAAELDPLSPRILDNFALAVGLQGRVEESLALNERALALQPESLQAGVWRALDLSSLGRHAEALAQLRKLPLKGTFYVPWTVKVYVAAGLRAEAEQMMGNLTGDELRFKYAGLAALGRPDEALASLPTDSVSAAQLSDLYFNRDLDPVRDDSRFVQLLATIGCTEANARARTWRASLPVRTEK
jgi:TolB-like protein/Flp pilus assembly protein TadD